jgi:predicted transcriptional regulator
MGCTTSVPVSSNEKIEPIPEHIVIEKKLDEASNASNDSNSIQINLKDMKSQTKILKLFNKNIKNSNNNVDTIKNVINTYDEHVFNLVKDEESELGYFIDNYILLMKYLKKRDKLETQYNFVIHHSIIELKKNKVKIGLNILDNRINRTTRKVLKRKIKLGAKECLDYWFYRVEKKIDLFLETDDDEIIISMYSKVLSKLSKE